MLLHITSSVSFVDFEQVHVSWETCLESAIKIVKCEISSNFHKRYQDDVIDFALISLLLFSSKWRRFIIVYSLKSVGIETECISDIMTQIKAITACA